MNKLGKATDKRLALLKNQVSNLLWKGEITTTFARAKEVQKLAEKYITLAVNTYEDIYTAKKVRIVDGKETTVDVQNDGPQKLAARRMLMANLNDLKEEKISIIRKTSNTKEVSYEEDGYNCLAVMIPEADKFAQSFIEKKIESTISQEKNSDSNTKYDIVYSTALFPDNAQDASELIETAKNTLKAQAANKTAEV